MGVYTYPAVLTTGATVGTGTGSTAAVGGRLLATGNLALTTSGTSAEILYTYTIPANLLSGVGDAVRLHAWWNCAANANNKLVIFRFNGAAGANLLQCGTTTSNNVPGWGIVEIQRVSASAQECIGYGQLGSTSAVGTNRNATALDLTTALTIDLQVTTSAAAGDLTIRGVTVDYLPA